MLRWTVAVLIAANLLFFAWTRGWLDPLVGVGPQGDREPQRLQRQVHPERVQVQPLTASDAEAPDDDGASAPARTEPFSTAASDAMALAPATARETAQADRGTTLACLEAGPLDAADVRSAEAALRSAGVAPQRWQVLPAAGTPVWLVYMGRFADTATLQHKEAELQRIHVGFEEVQAAPALEPGLSLGRFGDQAAAEDALARLGQRGVRTARLVALKTASMQQVLRAAPLEPALVAQLQAQPWPLPGRGLRPCSAATAAGRSAASTSAG